MVRIVAISDTHNHHRSLVIPDGDILIHAGDFTVHGQTHLIHKYAIYIFNLFANVFLFDKYLQISDFNLWLQTLPHKVKIVIPGNHENVVIRKSVDPLRSALTNAVSHFK